MKKVYINEDESLDYSDVQTYTINVNQFSHDITAQQLVTAGLCSKTVKSSKPKVATAQVSTSGDQLILKVTPKGLGTTTITVSFGGKKCKLKFTVKQRILGTWFDFSGYNYGPVPEYGYDYDVLYVNTKKNKPAKLKLIKTQDAINAGHKKYTCKLVYRNNKKKGSYATVTVVGTGNYVCNIPINFVVR